MWRWVRPPPQENNHPREVSVPDKANRLSKLSKQGSEEATRQLTDLLLQAGGVNPDLANVFDFRERIIQSEVRFRRKKHPGISEAQAASVLCELADRLSLPAYAHTSAKEIRRLRVDLLPLFPQILGSDKEGAAVNDQMSPLETVFIASAMVQQKLVSPRFQMTPDERRHHLDKKAGRQEFSRRSSEVLGLVSSGTKDISLRDLALEADTFLAKLGVEPLEPKEGK